MSLYSSEEVRILVSVGCLLQCLITTLLSVSAQNCKPFKKSRDGK